MFGHGWLDDRNEMSSVLLAAPEKVKAVAGTPLPPPLGVWGSSACGCFREFSLWPPTSRPS